MAAEILRHLVAFSVIYPLMMTVIWCVSAVAHYWTRERGRAVAGDGSPPPPVSILVPCHNEAALIAETITALAKIEHPDYEVIAIDDGSTDQTAARLDALALRHPFLRVLRQPTNQGKAAALIAGAHAARHDLLVCVDADALLDTRAPAIFACALAADPRLGAVTGNPRVRNTGSLLGKLQSGEFSAIIAVIKRAQQFIAGRIFTISGVVCAFRREALADVGWWSRDMAAEDIDITWKLNLAGWRTAYLPDALCRVLMPETFGGLWRQRLRWAQGGCEVLLRYGARASAWSRRQVWPLLFELVAGLLWSHAVAVAVIVWLLTVWMGSPDGLTPGYELFPPWSRLAMGAATVLQFAAGFCLDARYETGRRPYFVLVWYPLAYWIIGVSTSVAGFALALFRLHRHRDAVWQSPDRGFLEIEPDPES